MGGAHSNHLLATSWLTALYQIKTIGLVRGQNHGAATVLEICMANGMQLIMLSPDEYRNLRNTGDPKPFLSPSVTPYFISEGGFGEISAAGCKNIIDEIKTPFDHIFCACATGTTLAGMLIACNEVGQQSVCHGICALRPKEMIYNNILSIIGNTPHVNLMLHDQYIFWRFGKPAPEVVSFMQYFKKATGIDLDFNYTGKMMMGVFDLIRKGLISDCQAVVAVHTGGQETAGLKHLDL